MPLPPNFNSRLDDANRFRLWRANLRRIARLLPLWQDEIAIASNVRRNTLLAIVWAIIYLGVGGLTLWVVAMLCLHFS